MSNVQAQIDIRDKNFNASFGSTGDAFSASFESDPATAATIDLEKKEFNADFMANAGSFDASFMARSVTEIRDYNRLDNKPSIEGVVLIGDKTFPQLNMNSLTNHEIEDLLTL
jgi:hypothetical protein